MKEERALRTFHILIHVTHPRETDLPNVSLKRFQLHQRMSLTNTTTVLPNAPLLLRLAKFVYDIHSFLVE
jgi:hypothetical protein